MISVQFKSLASGACQWCGKERDAVYDVAFSDQSFIGKLCRNDLLRAIGMKMGGAAADRKPAVPVPASPVATANGERR